MTTNGITVRDVGRHAGVSIATVSRVVRGVGQIAPDTRQRVLAAIDELGYRPNHSGRALVERRHGALGIILPGLSGPYFSEVIEGFEVEALAAGVSVLILGTHLLRESDDLVLDLAGRVDGMVIFGGAIDEQTVRKLVVRGVPTVLLAGQPIADLVHVPAVRVENRAATAAITRHLLHDHGHRDLVFLGDPTDSPDVGDRWRGFLDAHAALGLAPPAAPVRTGHNQPHGLLAAATLLDAADPPRGIVCANDEVALGVYAAAAARGIAIPTRLVVTGWDDIAMAALLSPPLTTIRQPMRQLGAAAGQTLHALIDHLRGESPQPANLTLPTEIVLRSSCGCSPFAAPAERRSLT